jgi:hypothetical protein
MQTEIIPLKSNKFQTIRKTILVILTICISLFGWLRFTGAIQVYGYLLQLGINPHPIYYVLSGLIIGMSFLVAAIACAFSSQWVFKYLRICGSCLAAYLLIENLLIRSKSDLIQLIFVFFVLILIFLLTGKNRGSKIEDANEKIIARN